MLKEHQQMIVNDLTNAPRPGEREIFRKPASVTHHERPVLTGKGGNLDE